MNERVVAMVLALAAWPVAIIENFGGALGGGDMQSQKEKASDRTEKYTWKRVELYPSTRKCYLDMYEPTGGLSLETSTKSKRRRSACYKGSTSVRYML